MANAGLKRFWYAAGKNKTEAKASKPFFVLAGTPDGAQARAEQRVAGSGQKVFPSEPKPVGGRPPGSKNKPKQAQDGQTATT